MVRRKTYDVRFHPSRVKKILQMDDEVGKMTAAVPVMVSRTAELFIESMLTAAVQISNSKNSALLSHDHLKQCILQNQRFDFLGDLLESGPPLKKESKIHTEKSNFVQIQTISSGSDSYPANENIDDEDYDI